MYDSDIKIVSGPLPDQGQTVPCFRQVKVAEAALWRKNAKRLDGNCSQQNPRNRRVEQRGHEADEQRPQSQSRQVVPPVGRNRADAAELDADGGEVRKSGERK